MSVCAGAGKVQHSGHTAAPADTRASVGAHLWGLHAPTAADPPASRVSNMAQAAASGGREGGGVASCHLAIRGSIWWLCIVLFGGCGVCCPVVAVGF